MAETAEQAEQRQRYPDATVPGAALLLRLLMRQDGSTTRMCEAVAGGPVQLRLRAQRVTSDVPAQVRALLPGELFIERVTSLVTQGLVLSDNLVHVAMHGLDPVLQDELQTGRRPIGHLLDGRWHRRNGLAADDAVLQRLWATVGTPDPMSMRCYAVDTPEGPRMLICEAFRGGLWQVASAAGLRSPLPAA